MGARRSFKADGPAQISAVTAWLRNTATSGSVASVEDMLHVNPATAAGTAQPTALTANSLPILDFDGTTDLLSWPAVTAINNQTVTAGFGFWFSPDTVAAGVQGLICAIPGATNRVEILRSTAALVVDVYVSQFASRRATVAAAFAAGVKYLVTWEYNGGGSTDAEKCVLTINTVAQVPTFSDSGGAPGAMPATLVSSVGPFTIGARNPAALGTCDGKFGTNLYAFGSKMTGATTGLLTSAARASLFAFEPYG